MASKFQCPSLMLWVLSDLKPFAPQPLDFSSQFLDQIPVALSVKLGRVGVHLKPHRFERLLFGLQARKEMKMKVRHHVAQRFDVHFMRMNDIGQRFATQR